MVAGGGRGYLRRGRGASALDRRFGRGTGGPCAGRPPAPAPAAAAALHRPGASAYRVTGLPDFSGLVAEYGPAVVKVSVVEKPQKFGNYG